MAIANFFSKFALSASQILTGYESEKFIEILNTNTVAIVFDQAAVESKEARMTIEMAANLFARLFPKIALIDLSVKNAGLVENVSMTMRSINPDVEILLDSNQATVSLVIGNTKFSSSGPIIYIGSDGWLVRVSIFDPVASGNSDNPFGAAASACFGTANVFRSIFGSQLTDGSLDKNFTFSLLSYEQSSETKVFNPHLGSIYLGETLIVGLGAIGSAATWSLSRLPNLTGVLNLIDHECIELSNLQRYVLTQQSDIGADKVTLAKKAFGNSPVMIRTYKKRWGDYLTERNNWKLERVAVAVDTGRDRIAVQASLPKRIINSWTQTHDLGISIHEFCAPEACLACLYLPTEQVPDFDDLVARSIGLPEALMEVRTMLYKQTPVNDQFLARIAAALKIPAASLLPFLGKPLSNFYSEAVCGGIIFSLEEKTGSTSKVEVPMAFQSALAGILLASEIVIDAAKLRPSRKFSLVRINLLRPLGDYLSFRQSKHPSGFCFCQDPDYIESYAAKWN